MTNSRSDPTLAEIIKTAPLTRAEGDLIAACKKGKPLFIGDQVPDTASDDNSIRGELIRHILLGGCDGAPAHANGVWIGGAVITGHLNFSNGVTDQQLGLIACRVDNDMDFMDSQITLVNFTRSQVGGIGFERVQIKHDVFLRSDFIATGLINLRGADIGGQLACIGGQFDQGINGQGLKVGQHLFFRGVKINGAINLTSAQVQDLVDDMDSWRGADKLHLNGFRYGIIHSDDLSVQDRLEWIKMHRSFYSATPTDWTKALDHKITPRYEPQPYRQLAKVYENMGHARSAARVREASEDHHWAHERARIVQENDGTWTAGFQSIPRTIRCQLAWFFKILVGYGHAPLRALAWATWIVVIAIVFYAKVYNAGDMAPNSDIILTSPQWRAYADCPDRYTNPADAWSNSLAGQDYETFHAIGYGIDLFIPLDALGQENAWAPSKTRGGWGAVGFYLRWFIQFMGWVITAVGAAALTGLIGRAQPPD